MKGLNLYMLLASDTDEQAQRTMANAMSYVRAGHSVVLGTPDVMESQFSGRLLVNEYLAVEEEADEAGGEEA